MAGSYLIGSPRVMNRCNVLHLLVEILRSHLELELRLLSNEFPLLLLNIERYGTCCMYLTDNSSLSYVDDVDENL